MTFRVPASRTTSVAPGRGLRNDTGLPELDSRLLEDLGAPARAVEKTSMSGSGRPVLITRGAGLDWRARRSLDQTLLAVIEYQRRLMPARGALAPERWSGAQRGAPLPRR